MHPVMTDSEPETESDNFYEEDSDYNPSCDSSASPREEDTHSDGAYHKRPEKRGTVKLAGNAAKGVDENDIQRAKTDGNLYAEAINVITGGGDIKKLRLSHYKAYLRKHSLRLSGSKDVLLKRIQEHLELKDGGGVEKYPPSSFIVNCTGDACVGDVVKFEQKVYEGYDIVSRSSAMPPLGERVVAGRVIKESYGSKKQQHTFTVEVLWSTGVKALPPLYPLIIKGRNLYRLKTFRQYWSSEEERRRILEEKHTRGAVARRQRVIRINGRNHGHTQEKTLNHNSAQAAHSKGNFTESVNNVHDGRTVGVTKGRVGNTVRRPGGEQGSAHTEKMTIPTVTDGNAYDQNHLSIVKAFVSIKALFAGLVIGKGGTNIKEISKVSGAKLHVVEDEQDPALRWVQIIGTAGQIQVAKEMVLRRVMNKRSFQAGQNTDSIGVIDRCALIDRTNSVASENRIPLYPLHLHFSGNEIPYGFKRENISLRNQ